MMTCAASMDAAAFWPGVMESSLWTILARKNQTGLVTRNSAVPFVGRKSLDTEDQNTGWVYIYQVQGDLKLLKIGYTSRSVVERH